MFLPPECRQDDRFVVSGRERRHLADSLRVRRGEQFLATDGAGVEYVLEAESVAKTELVARVLEAREEAVGLGDVVTLAIAPPKGSRMETAIEKATECGVGRILPLITHRSVVKARDDSERLDRWRRVARSAAAQCGRCRVPEIGAVTSFVDALHSTGRVMLAHPDEEAVSMSAALHGVVPGTPVTILIGPEGGFGRREAKEARRTGAALVSLGRTRLRTETAAIVAVALAIATLERRED
ncbi:MAG: 16S rRNA (uracil(1498)-N(3))-methyltransferase [bacterium]